MTAQLMPFEMVDTAEEFYTAIQQRFDRNVRNGWGNALGGEFEGHLHKPGHAFPELRVPEFLKIRADRCCAPRLSNCQDSLFTPEVHLGRLEALTIPAKTVDGLMAEAVARFEEIDEVSAEMGLEYRDDPVIPVPDDYMTTVLPELRTSERFLRLTPTQIRAALSVACIQFQRGVRSWDQAIAVYRACVEELDTFMSMGDRSGGRRLGLYPQWVSPELADPPMLRSKEEAWEHARRFGYYNAPKGWWGWIRINYRNGTVEVRVYDASRDISHIRGIAEHFAHVTAPYVDP